MKISADPSVKEAADYRGCLCGLRVDPQQEIPKMMSPFKIYNMKRAIKAIAFAQVNNHLGESERSGDPRSELNSVKSLS